MSGAYGIERLAERGLIAWAGRIAALLGVGLLLNGCTLTDLLRTQSEGGSEPDGADQTATVGVGAPAEGAPLQVDSVEVLILESFPVQVNLLARGTVPDACTEIGEVRQERAGNAVTVTIATTRDPAALCAQVLTAVEETIPLEGDFPPGEYTVPVNGVTQAFRV